MYATVQDCIDRLGSEAVDRFADDPYPPEGTARAWTALETALADASEEIDGYVGARHELPLDPVPGVLVRACVELGAWLRCQDADLATDRMRERVSDVRKLLRDIAEGRVALGSRDPDPPAQADSPAASFDAPSRVLTRESLKGVL